MRNVYTFDVLCVCVHVKYDSISSHVIWCNKRHHKGCNDINVCFNCKMFVDFLLAYIGFSFFFIQSKGIK